VWKKCRSVFDEPVMLLVWEWEEALLGLALFGLGQFVIGPVWSTGVAVGMLILTYQVKKGKPAGAVVHWLHRIRCPFFRLPGVLPAQPQTYGPWS
jgi:hypothetical protein